MAASALGLPSVARLAAAGERVCSLPPSFSSSHSQHAAPPSSCVRSYKLVSEARRGSLALRSGAPCILQNSSVRSSFRADAGAAEPSSSYAEAPLPPALSSSSSAVAEATFQTGPPSIDLEFLGLGQGQDGVPVVDKVSVISGEKLLRTVMNEKKLELYDLFGKIMNCGGGGSCGTCIVEVLEGSDLLNERTDAEERHLNKKPSTWRLACQTIVGDKSNSGKVVVQRFPHKKK